jgi:hypothetical protein
LPRGVIVIRNVRQVGIADSSATVPAIHGVDGLAELHEVGLINTAGVNPSITQSIFLSLLTASPKLD